MTRAIEMFYETDMPEELVGLLNAIETHNCLYYASEFLSYPDLELRNIENDIRRALSVFSSSEISTDEHFVPVYRVKDGKTYKDWKLSRMACFYVAINANPGNPRVGSFQHYIYELVKDRW